MPNTNTTSTLLKNFSGASLAMNLAQKHLKHQSPIAIVVEDGRAADILKDQLNFFLPQAKIDKLPLYDVPAYSGLSPLRRTVLKTLHVLFNLNTNQLDFLIIPKKTLLRRLIKKEIFNDLKITLTKNDLIDRDELIQKLVFMGYEKYSVVEEPGHFAVRGDIIDIFSPQYDKPYRISLFDIEIETIKPFNPINQRTETPVSEVVIIPSHEIFLQHYHSLKTNSETQKAPEWANTHWKSELKKRTDSKNIQKQNRDQIQEFIENRIYFHGIEFFLPLFYHQTGTLFEYLKPNTLLVFDLEDSILSFANDHIKELVQNQNESSHIETIINPDELYLNKDCLSLALASFNICYHNIPLNTDYKEEDGLTESNLVLKSKISSQITKVHSLAPLVSEINDKRLKGVSCYIVSSNQVQKERIHDLLKRFELPLTEVKPEFQNDVMKQIIKQNNSERLVTLLIGDLHEGFYSHDRKEWWLTDEDIFGTKTKRAKQKTQATTVFSSFADLVAGDYIVHMDHGVGIYQGLTKLDVDPHQNDLVLLEYLGGDKLYVPIDKLSRLQKFAAAEGLVPQLDKLGTQTWIKTRSKAKRAAKKLAKELLDLQAKREMLKGHMFSSNLELNEEFAASFTFDETPDQLTTINQVAGDMEDTKPMDRLVCGDVGYGKTEVAIRATYKAVLDNKQVALLVPTTVLAFQHYQTLKERFKNYPVNVALLSRFRSQAEQKKTIKELEQGKVDVIVGTHRLLSKDIRFRDLGLLVVDEEHRFGVTHKEKIKKLKSLVDVLTLTATPIPRTLNLSLNGIRDLSIINTPPIDRLAIRTYTCYFDDNTLRDAIMKELRREGQIFFVHNRVQSIEKITKQIAELVPEAKVRFAHGQMHEEHLEDIMISFMEHEFDILVCTTIIESGLDIPNANTMIINRADRFGLAQLYQLRGRVGRSDKQAYCYLIVPHEDLQTTKAKRRLAVIQRFTELGSGFKVASHDLEIRGAGNILGDDQSGHIAAIGYDLYVHLLQEAIHELKNTHMPEDFEPEITLNFAAKIPQTYIPDEQLRLVLYKQLSSCKELEDVNDTREEWLDRFGLLPEETENLISLIKIKILCQKALVSQIKQSGKSLIFSFHPDHQIDISIFTKAVQANAKEYAITRDGKFVVTKNFKSTSDQIEYIINFVSGLL